MTPEAACFNDPEPFGAGKSYGRPRHARELCAGCPIPKGECLSTFIERNRGAAGVHSGMTVAGLTGRDLVQAIRRLTRKSNAA